MREDSTWKNVEHFSKGYSYFSTLTYIGRPWHWWKGEAEFQLGRDPLNNMKIAYEHNPYNIQTLNGLGKGYGMNRQNDKARMYLEDALDICPDYETARTNLNVILKRY